MPKIKTVFMYFYNTYSPTNFIKLLVICNDSFNLASFRPLQNQFSSPAIRHQWCKTVAFHKFKHQFLKMSSEFSCDTTPFISSFYLEARCPFQSNTGDKLSEKERKNIGAKVRGQEINETSSVWEGTLIIGGKTNWLR